MRTILSLTGNSHTEAEGQQSGSGGVIKILGNKVGLFDSSIVNVSGDSGGGTVLIGGDKEGKNSGIRNAKFVFLDQNSNVFADATDVGDGGKIVAFSQDTTRIYGGLYARGGKSKGNGGFIETSGLDGFEILDAPNLTAVSGEGGEWLIDPHNIQIISGGGNTNINSDSPFVSTADGASLDVGLIVTALSTGTDVSITTADDASSIQDGNILFNTDMDYTGTGNSTLTLNAENNITFSPNIAIGGSNNAGESLTINLYAKGVVTINGLAQINTQGGDFTVGDTTNNILPTDFTNHGIINTSGGIVNITSSGDITLSSGSSMVSDGGGVLLNTSGLISAASDIATNTGNFVIGYTDKSATTISSALSSGINITGNIDTRANGGVRAANGNNGAAGGNVAIAGANAITVAGTIDTRGQEANDSSFTNGRTGGSGGSVTIDSTSLSATDTVSVNSIDATGGAGDAGGGETGDGGDAGVISITGPAITLNSNISAAGGANASGGQDGNGADITLTGPVTLATSIALDSSSGATRGDIVFADTISPTAARSDALSLVGRDISFGGNVGSSSAYLGNLTVDAGRYFNASTNNLYINALDLSASSITTFAAGDVYANGALNSAGSAVNISASDSINVGYINTSGGAAAADSAGLAGGKVSLTSQVINVGAITTIGSSGNSTTNNRNGGSGGDITIHATGNTVDAAITLTGALNFAGGGAAQFGGSPGGNGAVSIELLGSRPGVLTIANASAFLMPFTVTGNTSDDTLSQNTSRHNAWNITSSGAGTLNGTSEITFAGFENLVGGTGVDDFVFSNTGGGRGDISGSIDGGGGSGINTVTAHNLHNIWTIDGTDGGNFTNNDGGTNVLVDFSNIQDLIGNGQADDFTLSGGSISGYIDGAGGADSLTGDDLTNTWQISSTTTGSLTTTPLTVFVNEFRNIESLRGGSGQDTL